MSSRNLGQAHFGEGVRKRRAVLLQDYMTRIAGSWQRLAGNGLARGEELEEEKERYRMRLDKVFVPFWYPYLRAHLNLLACCCGHCRFRSTQLCTLGMGIGQTDIQLWWTRLESTCFGPSPVEWASWALTGIFRSHTDAGMLVVVWGLVRYACMLPQSILRRQYSIRGLRWG